MHKVFHYIRIGAILFTVAGCSFLFAQDSKESLWEYAVPTADVVLYVNTKQPEANMEKALWQRITRDKEKAIAQNAVEPPFDIKNRDIELIANLFIHSTSSFSCSIEGVANIFGNIKNDMTKLLQISKDNNGPSPQITKQGDLDLYNFSIAGTPDIPPVDIMLIPIDNNYVQFKINFVPQGGMIRKTMTPSGKTSSSINRIKNQELAFAILCRTEKISALSFPGTSNAKKLKNFLTKIEELSFYGFVRGKDLIVTGIFTFKSVGDAGIFNNSIQSVLPQISSMVTFSSNPKVVIDKNDVRLTANINIADAWSLITRATKGAQNTAETAME